jgi:hypothetical protein
MYLYFFLAKAGCTFVQKLNNTLFYVKYSA